MDFDFKQQYEAYSNVELLKIVKRPENYQRQAVAVAADILSRRQVTDEEQQAAERYYFTLDSSVIRKKQKIDALTSKAESLFAPVIHPTEHTEPGKWVNLFLLVVALQYLWLLYTNTRWLIHFLRCSDCRFYLDVALNALSLIYIPIVSVLLYQRKRWGWILLFVDNLFVLLSLVGQSYIFFKYQNIHRGSTSSYLLTIFVRSAFVFFLLRKPITDYFGVSRLTKQKTAFITTTATLIFILLMYVFN